MKKISLLLFVGVYLLTTGVSFAVFSFLAKPQAEEVLVSPEVTSKSKFEALLVGPKDRLCPLNGMKFTQKEEELWQSRRPLLVMIENHADSRPQSGLSRADIVYEAIAEGAIARFMAVYYCGTAIYSEEGEYDIGPVRSARTYFLDWASEYGDYPLYSHVGGAGQCSDPTVNTRAKALCQLERYGWKNKGTWSDLDQFSLGFKICRREPDRTGKTVATEHSMYCGTYALWKTAETRGLTNLTLNSKKQNSWDVNFKQWLFKDDAPSGEAVSPEFEFWTDYKDYAVKWEYDSAKNNYKRINGGVAQQDFYTKEYLAAKNVVIQFMKETANVDEHKHLLYQTTGEGKAIVFQDGKAIVGKWIKKDRTSRTRFVDSSGKEIQFNRGQIWLEIVPTTSKVSY